MMARHDYNTYKTWQWNCTGYSRKRANLQQYLINNEQPNVILLQETNTKAKLSGYRSFNETTPRDKPAVATLVQRNLTVTPHEIKQDTIPHLLLQIVPTKKRDDSLFILNVYSSPRRNHRFLALLKKVFRIADNRAVLVAGDFNAHHAAWGYKYETRKERYLWEDSQQESLTLVTYPSAPTQKGNSVCSDTSPDLAFVKNIGNVRWTNAQEDLGSDHTIIEDSSRRGTAQAESQTTYTGEMGQVQTDQERGE